MAITLPTLRSASVLETPAHRFMQGQRNVYYFTLAVDQFDDALPEEVDAKVIRESQRRFISSHALAIKDYLSTTDQWVLGPITLCIDPRYVKFEPYGGQPHDASPIVGELKIIQGGKPFLKILDGQHRRWAIRKYRTSPPSGDVYEKRRQHFEQSQMPVALYEESDTASIRQMFADMAQQRKMDAVTTARFDMRDPFNQAADQLMGRSDWIAQFVEMNASAVPRSSEKLVAFNQLAVNLKTLMYGYYGRASHNRSQEAALDIESIVKLGREWIDVFLPTARVEYHDLIGGEVDPDYIPLQRAHTLAYNGTMLRILAGCYYEWTHQYPDLGTDVLAQFINEINLDPNQPTGLSVESGVLDLKPVILIARRQEVVDAIRAIVRGAHALHVNAENGN